MSYRIAGIDVHKKMLAVVVSDVEVDGEYQFERRMFGVTPNNYDRWLHGYSSKRSRKWSWNRRRNTGDRPGKRWNGTGNRRARNGKAQARSREHCIWRRRSPIAGRGGARKISEMPNVWSSGWW